MCEDLIKRLQKQDRPFDSKKSAEDQFLRDEAADALEALQAERDQYGELLRNICGELELPHSESGPCDDPLKYEQAIEGLREQIIQEIGLAELQDAQRAAKAQVKALREALTNLTNVIDAAGLDNLSNGVQLGPTVWFVKATDAMNYARAALKDHT